MRNIRTARTIEDTCSMGKEMDMGCINTHKEAPMMAIGKITECPDTESYTTKKTSWPTKELGTKTPSTEEGKYTTIIPQK